MPGFESQCDHFFEVFDFMVSQMAFTPVFMFSHAPME